MKSTHGVSYYTFGVARFPVPFPEGRTICAYCPHLTRVYGMRHQCRITDEILLYPETQRGERCPVEFDEGNEVIPT